MRSQSFLIIIIGLFLVTSLQTLTAQNIPPMIGNPIGKPKGQYPNPFERNQGQSGSESSQASSAASEKELAGFVESWKTEFSRKDLESLGSHYLQTPDLRVYWESHEFAGWESFKAELQRRLSAPEGFQIEIRNPEIRAFGRFAWITAHYFRQQWLDGRPSSHEGLMTLILEKRRSHWTILHQHGSSIPAATELNLSTK
jgi:ketosteroid isomerase-like protein